MSRELEKPQSAVPGLEWPTARRVARRAAGVAILWLVFGCLFGGVAVEEYGWRGFALAVIFMPPAMVAFIAALCAVCGFAVLLIDGRTDD